MSYVYSNLKGKIIMNNIYTYGFYFAITFGVILTILLPASLYACKEAYRDFKPHIKNFCLNRKTGVYTTSMGDESCRENDEFVEFMIPVGITLVIMASLIICMKYASYYWYFLR